MRLAILLLLAVPVFAGPITFTFEGTWQNSTSDIAGVSIVAGESFTGAFEFERFSAVPGDVAGRLLFSLGPLIFEPLVFLEEANNGGHMQARTNETACNGFLGPTNCLVIFNLRPSDFGGSDFGILAEYPVAIEGITGTTDIRVTPYNPFAYIPEPSTVLLVATALLLLKCAQVRRRC